MESEHNSDENPNGFDCCTPAFKKSKISYKFCLHCSKEVSKKIYKEHERLFYDSSKRVWVTEKFEDENCSSDYSSVDEFDKLNVSCVRVHHDQADEFSDLEREVDDDQPTSTNHQDVSCAAEGKV